MARRTPRPEATEQVTLRPSKPKCESCGGSLWVAKHKSRKITTLRGVYDVTVVICQCHNRECDKYHQRYRPEEEGSWALPHGEFGLDVIALVGTLRFREHRSVEEIHQELLKREVKIAERTVKYLIQRYEELVTIHMTDRERIQQLLQKQGRAILALDGLEPDAGHEVLWVIREVISQEILLARPLVSSAKQDLAALLREVKEMIPKEVKVQGIISDGQRAIGAAVAAVFPQVPHQLCQIHYLREASEPVVEADKHAKTRLKAHIRGLRPIERALEQGCHEVSGRNSQEAGESDEPKSEDLARQPEEQEATSEAPPQAAYKYCLAVRSALTDEGHPPLDLGGIKLHARLSQISDSLDRVAKKRG